MNYKHGYAKNGEVEKLHNLWRDMHKRCNNHPDYNGRGIIVCKEWHNYILFRKWALDNKYNEGLSIDRIDNNGSYSPDNCRFTSSKEQARNRRSNIFITYNGKRQCQAAWAEEYNIDQSKLSYRLRHGWTIEKSLLTP